MFFDNLRKMKVILFYKYVKVKDPETFQKEQLELCKSFGLKGRVFVGREGINGTLSGSNEDIEKYEKSLIENPLFSDIEFKEEEIENHVFNKLFVRVRKEIVNFSRKVNMNKRGKKISPKEFKELIETDKDLVILDVRNDYETKIGRFKGATTLDIDDFRQFPEKVTELNHLKNKKIVTYCTGGIRCEKASAFLVENGFEDVYQLDGGIIKYKYEVPNSYFEGRCFVFDERMSVVVNTGDFAKVISNCEICGTECDRAIDCCNNNCNRIFVCCVECEVKMNSGCSEYCSQHPTRSKWPMSKEPSLHRERLK